MRQILITLGLVLVVFASVVTITIIEEPSLSRGAEHPQVPAMRIGGDGAVWFEFIAEAATIFHAGSLLHVGAFMVLGVAPRHRSWRLSNGNCG